MRILFYIPLGQHDAFDSIGLKPWKGAILTRLFFLTVFVLTFSVNNLQAQQDSVSRTAVSPVLVQCNDAELRKQIDEMKASINKFSGKMNAGYTLMGVSILSGVIIAAADSQHKISPGFYVVLTGTFALGVLVNQVASRKLYLKRY